MTTRHATIADTNLFFATPNVASVRARIEARIREHANELVLHSKGSAEFAEKVADWFLEGELATALAEDLVLSLGVDHSAVRVLGNTVGFPEVLQALGSKAATGVLRLDGSGNRVDIHLEGGLIRYIDPIRATIWERTELFFSSEVEIHRGHIERCLETDERRREESLFVALFEDGSARFDNLPRLVQNLGAELVSACLTDPDSTRTEFVRCGSIESRFVELGLETRIPRFLLLLFSRADEWEMLRANLYSREPVFGVRRDETAGSKSQALSGEFAAILCAVDGERTVDEIAEECRLSLFETLSGLYSLLQMRVIEILWENDLDLAEDLLA